MIPSNACWTLLAGKPVDRVVWPGGRGGGGGGGGGDEGER